jgi:hypothetical protein
MTIAALTTRAAVWPPTTVRPVFATGFTSSNH